AFQSVGGASMGRPSAWSRASAAAVDSPNGRPGVGRPPPDPSGGRGRLARDPPRNRPSLPGQLLPVAPTPRLAPMPVLQRAVQGPRRGRRAADGAPALREEPEL